MKWIKLIYIIFSVLLAPVIAFAIVNSEVSYKYELEENYLEIGTIGAKYARGYLNSLIETLILFLSYVLINITILLFSIYHNKRTSNKC